MKKLSETMKAALIENVTSSYGVDWSGGLVLLFTDHLRTAWALEDRGLAVRVPKVLFYKNGRPETDGTVLVLTFEGIRIGVELANERGAKFPETQHA